MNKAPTTANALVLRIRIKTMGNSIKNAKRLIAQQTPIMILDEPAASLDFALSSKLTHILQNLAHEDNKTVLIVTHDINDAMKFSDYIILLKNGKVLVQGEPSIVINEAVLQELYGPQARLSEDSAGNKVAWASYQK